MHGSRVPKLSRLPQQTIPRHERPDEGQEMGDDQTFKDLFKAQAIFEVDLRAAVDAFMADPATERFLIRHRYAADLAAAVAAPWFVRETMDNGNATNELKRAAVRTAILLSRPLGV